MPGSAKALVELRGRRRGFHTRHHPLGDAAALARIDLGLEGGAHELLALFYRRPIRKAHSLHLELYAAVDDELAIRARSTPSASGGGTDTCGDPERSGPRRAPRRSEGGDGWHRRHARDTRSTFWMDGWMNGKVASVRQTRHARASRPSESAADDGAPAAIPTPEDLLHKAMVARSTLSRARWARRGLASRAPLDKTTHAMLLRQLYLSYYEERRFERARATALEALTLGVLADVIHQDAARAALGEGDLAAAVAHLRVAARRSPPSRRCFHHWTLGSVFFLAGRYAESAGALERAVRWATRDKPLYRAHLALVQIAAGERVDDLRGAIEELAVAPCGQGYGRFILGHLSYAAGAWDSARKFLEAFIERTESSRPELALSLDGELKMSRATLAKISAN